MSVYTTDEEVDPASKATAPRELERFVDVVIVGALEATDDCDDLLDDLAEEIERVMHADETFGAVCAGSIMASTKIDVVEDGKRDVGYIRIIYKVEYQTWAPDAADVPLDSFEQANVNTSLENAQPAGDQAQDVIELEGS